MTTLLPISSTTLYQQPDGTYSDASTGVAGETAVVMPITDAAWMDDADPNGAETTSDLQSLTQDLYHVLWESYGANLDDPTRGVGIEGALSASSDVLAQMPSQVDRQFELDTRVQRSQSTLTQTDAITWSMLIQVWPVGSVLPIQFSWSSSSGLQLVRTA